MNLAYIHLLLNHIPVLGVPFGVILLILSIFRKSEELKKVSFGVFVVAAIAAPPVYLSGEPAEEIVESLPGASQAAIEEHEESALLSLIAAEILGVIALIGLLHFRRLPLPNRMVIVVLILSLVVAASMARTANLGGQIRHSEIRAGAAN